MTKRLFFFIIINLSCLVGNLLPARYNFDGSFAHAQEMVVKDCELNPDNHYAENHPRSWEDVPCAVLIIKTPNIAGISFPNVAQHVGDIEYKDGNYYVYMVENAYKLSLRHKDYQPLDIDLKESFGIRVKSSKTYELDLTKTEPSNNSGQCVAQFKITPIVDGNVEFDGQKKEIPSTGIVEFRHIPGSFTYVITAENYKKENGTIELQQGTEAVNVRLRPETVPVEITCNVGNATVFVDNVSYGKPGVKMLPLGKHVVSLRANKYLDEERSITITKSLPSQSFNLEKNKGQTTIINPTPITIYSSSTRLYKNNREIKGWSSGAVVKFMPGVKCRISDDNDNHCIFAAGTTPKIYTFENGKMIEGEP